MHSEKGPMVLSCLIQKCDVAGLANLMNSFVELLKLAVTCKQKPFTFDHVILLLIFNNHSILLTQAYTQNNNKNTAKFAHTPNVNLSNQSTVSVFPCHQRTPTAGLTNKDNDHTVQIPVASASPHNVSTHQTSINVSLRVAPFVLLPPKRNTARQLTGPTRDRLARRIRPGQPHEHIKSVRKKALDSTSTSHVKK